MSSDWQHLLFVLTVNYMFDLILFKFNPENEQFAQNFSLAVISCVQIVP